VIFFSDVLLNQAIYFPMQNVTSVILQYLGGYEVHLGTKSVENCNFLQIYQHRSLAFLDYPKF
jgi:hypothetical protein